MPALQLMSERANNVFNRTNIQNISPSLFVERSFADIAVALGIATNELERRVLNSWPASLQAAITAIIQSAVQRDYRLPVTIAWSPGYDFEVTATESKSVDGSMGGITIFLRSRYPLDPVPNAEPPLG